MNNIVRITARITTCIGCLAFGMILIANSNLTLSGAALIPTSAATPGLNSPAGQDAASNLSPAAIKLASFTAKRLNTNTVQIDWTTSLEKDTFGFRLLRSTTSNLADAVYIISQNDMILGKGGFGLTPYQFIDTSAPSIAVYYWLEETEISGLVNPPYGPVSDVAQPPTTTPTATPIPTSTPSPDNVMKPRIYIPLVMR